MRLDLSDRASRNEAAAHLAETSGHLDVLVNNAAGMPDFQVLSALEADMDAVRAAARIMESLHQPCRKTGTAAVLAVPVP